jgi:hypothetical protein
MVNNQNILINAPGFFVKVDSSLITNQSELVRSGNAAPEKEKGADRLEIVVGQPSDISDLM